MINDVETVGNPDAFSFALDVNVKILCANRKKTSPLQAQRHLIILQISLSLILELPETWKVILIDKFPNELTSVYIGFPFTRLDEETIFRKRYTLKYVSREKLDK